MLCLSLFIRLLVHSLYAAVLSVSCLWRSCALLHVNTLPGKENSAIYLKMSSHNQGLFSLVGAASGAKNKPRRRFLCFWEWTTNSLLIITILSQYGCVGISLSAPLVACHTHAGKLPGKGPLLCTLTNHLPSDSPASGSASSTSEATYAYRVSAGYLFWFYF